MMIETVKQVSILPWGNHGVCKDCHKIENKISKQIEV